MDRLEPDRVVLWEASETRAYAHHPFITSFNGSLLAMWSSGIDGEDEPGQRVMIASSVDGHTWSAPSVLAAPTPDQQGAPRVLTPAGFLEHDGQLNAYCAEYSARYTETRLLAHTTTDGMTWSDPIDCRVPVSPNEGPRSLASGRLVLPAHTSLAFTDDPSGLSGWTLTGLSDVTNAPGYEDNPRTFREIAAAEGWDAAVCEASLIEPADGPTIAMLRATGDDFDGLLYASISPDRGRSWSEPAHTTFPDNDHKFQFGRLGTGEWFYLGTPDPTPRYRRSPLVLSLSADGLAYDRHFIVADEHTAGTDPRRRNNHLGYAQLTEHRGSVYVIASRYKASIDVFRFPLAALTDPAP